MGKKMLLVVPAEGRVTIDGFVADGHTIMASVDGVLYYNIKDAAIDAGLPSVVAADIDELALVLAEAGVSSIDEHLISRLGGGLLERQHREFLEDVVQHAIVSCVDVDEIPPDKRRILVSIYNLAMEEAYRIAVETAAAVLSDFNL